MDVRGNLLFDQNYSSASNKQHDSAKLIMFQENTENGDRVTAGISVGTCTALQAQLHALKKQSFRSAIFKKFFARITKLTSTDH